MSSSSSSSSSCEHTTKKKLNEQQQRVLEFVDTYKSFLLTGEAGTGKSFVCHELIRRCQERERKKHNEQITIVSRFWTEKARLQFDFVKYPRVAVCATTAYSALPLPQGKTFNSWAGIGLGQGTVQQILNRMKKEAKERWKQVVTLFIDEASLIDQERFSKLHELACILRNNRTALWGGIQLILVGDLFQLPPIAEKDQNAQRYSSKQGKYFFEADEWKTFAMDDHVFHLTQVYRQTDPVFKEFLGRLRVGKLTKEDGELIRSLSRELTVEEGKEPIVLFATKEETKAYNTYKLQELKTELKTFEKQDVLSDPKLPKEVQDFILANFDKNLPVQTVIELKVGAPVMLRFKLDEAVGLVNGVQGKVMSFSPRGHPIVLFSNGVERVCEPQDFEHRDFDDRLLMKRVQIPLSLCWACNVHQTVGLTLDKVVLNLSRTFGKGLEYVGCSRVRSMDDLQIKNLDISKIEPLDMVETFYQKIEQKNLAHSPQSRKRKLDQV